MKGSLSAKVDGVDDEPRSEGYQAGSHSGEGSAILSSLLSSDIDKSPRYRYTIGQLKVLAESPLAVAPSSIKSFDLGYT